MAAKYNNHYTQSVYEIVFPLLGDLMTQNVIKIQTKKIGKTENDITAADLLKLSEAIKTGLAIFLGSDGAASIAQKISAIK